LVIQLNEKRLTAQHNFKFTCLAAVINYITGTERMVYISVHVSLLQDISID